MLGCRGGRNKITTNRRCRGRKGQGGSTISVRLGGAEMEEMWEGGDNIIKDGERVDEKEVSNLGRSRKESKNIRCNNQPP